MEVVYKIMFDPGVVSHIAPPFLYPLYFDRPLDIGFVREL